MLHVLRFQEFIGLPIVKSDPYDAHVVSVEDSMTEAHTLPGSHQGGSAPDHLSEEVQVHGMPVAWL